MTNYTTRAKALSTRSLVNDLKYALKHPTDALSEMVSAALLEMDTRITEMNRIRTWAELIVRCDRMNDSSQVAAIKGLVAAVERSNPADHVHPDIGGGVAETERALSRKAAPRDDNNITVVWMGTDSNISYSHLKKGSHDEIQEQLIAEGEDENDDHTVIGSFVGHVSSKDWDGS